MYRWIICFLLLGFASQQGLTQTFQQRIQQSTDDAEEKFDGSNITTTSSDIELVYDSWNNQGLQTIGLRFNNVTIPANATITNAYIQFTADGSTAGVHTLKIKGEKVANSVTFSNTANNISSRTTTTAEVNWSALPAWTDNQAGAAQQTPDLSAVVAEVITSNGWQNGNPITFIITGTGSSSDRRRAYSFDEDPNRSAQLVIDYTPISNTDLAVTAIQSPDAVNFPDPAAGVAVEVLSFGNQLAGTYSVSYSVNGTVMATEPGTVPLSLGQSTVFTFQQTANLSALGNYTIEAAVSIANDADISNNTLSQSISVIPEVDTLFFNSGSSWRYYDAASDPGVSWFLPSFNDGAWSIGAGHFGFGEGDETTDLAAGLASYYFRKKVNVSNPSQLGEVYLHLVHDDAAIVYINGQEAFRSELMPQGAITHATTARQSSNSTNENEFYTYKIDPGLWVTGTNTIAISVRNRSTTNTDLSFDGYLTANFTYDQDGPYVYYDGNNIIVEEVTPGGLVRNTYTSTAGLQLTCTLPHMNTSFSFPLKAQNTIEPSEYPSTPPKFLTVSDFDGHIEGFAMLLRGEGIMDNNFNWTYGNGHLIITGDLFDRGFHITECMWLLYKLESEAEAAGGKVHLIIGNHEMFNLTDDWRYVEVKYFNNAHLMGKRMAELYDANTELGRWLRSKNIVERIGDYAFMHGGISPSVAALGLSYDQMNDFGRMEMNGTCTSNACNTITGSDGVYWYRGMVELDLNQTEVDSFVAAFGVKRVVVGHTKDNTIRSLYDGKVVAIDMYHVDNFANGFMEALQFELGCFYVFRTDNVNPSYTLIDDCDVYTNVYEVNQAGLLQIYPNPTQNTLNIKLPEAAQGSYTYTIIDPLGKVVEMGNLSLVNTSIDLSEYAAGQYHLVLQNSKETITGKFLLVEH